MAADEENVGSAEPVDGQVSGALAKLANEVIAMRREVTKSTETSQTCINVLREKVQPVSWFEKALIVFGAVAVTNFVFRLLASAATSHASLPSTFLESVSRWVSP